MKIHPTFERLMDQLICVPEGFYVKEWREAGKPVVEEEPNYLNIPKMGADGTAYRATGSGLWVVFDSKGGIPTKYVGTDPTTAQKIAEKDARIAELEAKLGEWESGAVKISEEVIKKLPPNYHGYDSGWNAALEEAAMAAERGQHYSVNGMAARIRGLKKDPPRG